LNEAMGVPFFYGVVEAAVLAVYCIIMWKFGWTKAPRNAPFWKVIVTSYEVLQAEKQELDSIEVSVSDSEDDVLPEHVNREGNILTHYFYFDPDALRKPKEPSGATNEELIEIGPV